MCPLSLIAKNEKNRSCIMKIRDSPLTQRDVRSNRRVCRDNERKIQLEIYEVVGAFETTLSSIFDSDLIGKTT